MADPNPVSDLAQTRSDNVPDCCTSKLHNHRSNFDFHMSPNHSRRTSKVLQPSATVGHHEGRGASQLSTSVGLDVEGQVLEPNVAARPHTPKSSSRSRSRLRRGSIKTLFGVICCMMPPPISPEAPQAANVPAPHSPPPCLSLDLAFGGPSISFPDLYNHAATFPQRQHARVVTDTLRSAPAMLDWQQENTSSDSDGVAFPLAAHFGNVKMSSLCAPQLAQSASSSDAEEHPVSDEPANTSSVNLTNGSLVDDGEDADEDDSLTECQLSASGIVHDLPSSTSSRSAADSIQSESTVTEARMPPSEPSWVHVSVGGASSDRLSNSSSYDSMYSHATSLGHAPFPLPPCHRRQTESYGLGIGQEEQDDLQLTPSYSFEHHNANGLPCPWTLDTIAEVSDESTVGTQASLSTSTMQKESASLGTIATRSASQSLSSCNSSRTGNGSGLINEQVATTVWTDEAHWISQGIVEEGAMVEDIANEDAEDDGASTCASIRTHSDSDDPDTEAEQMLPVTPTSSALLRLPSAASIGASKTVQRLQSEGTISTSHSRRGLDIDRADMPFGNLLSSGETHLATFVDRSDLVASVSLQAVRVRQPAPLLRSVSTPAVLTVVAASNITESSAEGNTSSGVDVDADIPPRRLGFDLHLDLNLAKANLQPRAASTTSARVRPSVSPPQRRSVSDSSGAHARATAHPAVFRHGIASSIQERYLRAVSGGRVASE